MKTVNMDDVGGLKSRQRLKYLKMKLNNMKELYQCAEISCYSGEGVSVGMYLMKLFFELDFAMGQRSTRARLRDTDR